MQLKVKVKDLENTNSYDPADKLIVLTDENTNISKNLDKSDLLTDIVSPDATNGLNIQNGGLYNKDISNIIGDLSDLTTPVKSNVVNAVNSIQNTINTDLNNIGDLSNLTTTDKTNLVGAVNELYNSISANKDLSNLSTNGEGRLHALKGYTESGQVYSDTQLYNDILTQYNNSPFDISKFTVVGSPTITSEGIASGFSSSNYIKWTTGYTDTNYSTIEINFPTFTTSSDITGEQYIVSSGLGYQILFGFSNGGYIALAIKNSSGTTITTTNTGASPQISTNTEYQCKLVFTGSRYDLYIKGGIWTEWTSIKYAETTEKIMLGANVRFTGRADYSNLYFKGSIDLRTFSITVDGSEVFSGVKTGTDLIITDNYTVVGSPTITDGIASGFSGSNNILSKDWICTLGNADNWEIELYIITPSDFGQGGGYQGFIGSSVSNKYAPSLQTVNAGSGLGKIRCLLPSTQSAWGIMNSQSSDTFSTNTLLGCQISFTGTQYFLKTKLSGEDWKTQITANNTNKIYSSGELLQFGTIGNASANYFRGSVLIDTVKITINGETRYITKSEIYYYLSAEGNKIVNINDIGSLQMLNNMSGGALYYTIDDTNSEAALPFGNVYGLINKRADGEWEHLVGSDIELSTVTAVNTYDIDLSSYITSNLYDYEAVFDIDAKRTDNNSNATNYIVSLLLGDGTTIANYSNTFYKAQSYGDQFSVLLPKNIRKIRLQISGYALSSHSLKLLAWRRKGGNY